MKRPADIPCVYVNPHFRVPEEEEEEDIDMRPHAIYTRRNGYQTQLRNTHGTFGEETNANTE